MMKKLISLLTFCTSLTYCQAQGINFSKPASWSALLQQAKAENKFIFIDGYATWCKPCKMMEESVYSEKGIGKFMNANFISVKVQVDQSTKDDVYVKSWYKDAGQLMGKYKLNVLPALLFLSPEGELLYRGEGYLNADKFYGLARFSIDPKSQEFHVKVDQYTNGTKSYTELPKLAKIVADILLNDSLATIMRKDYFENYLNKLKNPKDVLTHENMSIAFENIWLIKPNNKLIVELRKHTSLVSDSLTGWPGGATALLSRIVKKDELERILCEAGKTPNPRPDWTRLEIQIARKYPQVNVKQAIKEFQISGSDINTSGYFFRVGDWNKINEYFESEIKASLLKGDFEKVNNIGWWEYFCSVTDRKSLELAATWMDSIINKSHANHEIQIDDVTRWVDTKAALLYKAGHRQQAIATEEKALVLKQEDNMKNDRKKDLGCATFSKVIELMKNGEKIEESFKPVLYPSDWKLLD